MDEEETEDAVVARLEQTGLVVVVAVERLVLQQARACSAEARLLINAALAALAAEMPFCSFAEVLPVERAASTVDRLLCSELETWLVDRLDSFELFPPMVKPVALLVDWLAVGEALLVERAANTVDLLLCSEVETWLVDKLDDAFELFPPMVKLDALLVDWLAVGEALLVERAANTVDLLLCREVETWLVDKLDDPFEPFPPMVKPEVLVVD